MIDNIIDVKIKEFQNPQIKLIYKEVKYLTI